MVYYYLPRTPSAKSEASMALQSQIIACSGAPCWKINSGSVQSFSDQQFGSSGALNLILTLPGYSCMCTYFCRGSLHIPMIGPSVLNSGSPTLQIFQASSFNITSSLKPQLGSTLHISRHGFFRDGMSPLSKIGEAVIAARCQCQRCVEAVRRGERKLKKVPR